MGLRLRTIWASVTRISVGTREVARECGKDIPSTRVIHAKSESASLNAKISVRETKVDSLDDKILDRL
jgi:hypothetical protein